MLILAAQQMGFRKTGLTLALASVFIAPSVYATADNIEKIAVWSTQVKTSALYLQEQDIADKQADHISDLLRSIPGIDVGGAHSLNQRITIRSMDDKDLKISIDGAAQNSYMYHHMGNLQIHADILKSVDIETGTNSVINGGLGGAVRFETKEAADLLAPEASVGGRVSAGVANNAGHNFSLTGYGVLTEQLDFLAYYNQVTRDNYDVGGGEITDQTGGAIAGTDGTVRGLEGDVNDALLKVGWNIDVNQRLALSYETYEDKGHYSYRPDMGLATDLVFEKGLGTPLLWPTEFTRDTLTLSYDLEWGQGSALTVSIFSNVSELYRDEAGWALSPSPRFRGNAGQVTGEAKNSGLNLIAQTPFEALFSRESHLITYGADYLKHETDFHKLAPDNTLSQSQEEAKNLALFVQDRIEFDSGLVIMPGIRHDSYKIDSKVITNDFTELSLSLAAEYHLTENFLIKISSTELFKGPEIGEVFAGAGLRDSENNDIEAETGLNTELAIAYQRTIGDSITWSAGVTAFSTHIDNYIYDSAMKPQPKHRWDQWKDNIGDMQIDGFEAYSEFTHRRLSIQFTYAQSNSDLSAFSHYEVLDGSRLEREQGDTITTRVAYQFERYDLDVAWEGMMVGGVAEGQFLGGPSINSEKRSYTVHNLSVHWTPQTINALHLRVGIDNVFDEFYASQSSKTGVTGHPLAGEKGLFLMDYEPGRNIKASVAYQF
ncbi:TonB-dependent receptor [Pseudoalteromonas sp. MMG013]|uniref:TonB-dependent receptor domain-containing protein n=1 Tax=Pseudoalteromonas sp. MMG013 TaxID=2822687 RepID=UPI001B38CA42|nr:TonB-dependent receptor [Pseudoalteromonas sp. MMG013]MBQ4862075.1 TonB-dependent receptor [Pseudoalteromonas sp. MMG013]